MMAKFLVEEAESIGGDYNDEDGDENEDDEDDDRLTFPHSRQLEKEGRKIRCI